MRETLLVAVATALTACAGSDGLTALPSSNSGRVVSGTDAPREACGYSLAFDGDRYLGSTQCLVRADDVVSLRITEQPWAVYVWFRDESATANVFVPGWSEIANVVSMKRLRGERWELAMRLETLDGHLVLGEVWATP
jgi:hypothetical protein